MATREVAIGSSVGLHARPASIFVQAATATGLPVTIAKAGGNPVDARSILGVGSTCPAPRKNTSRDGTPRSWSARYRLRALAGGTRGSASPCWMSVGALAFFTFVMAEALT